LIHLADYPSLVSRLVVVLPLQPLTVGDGFSLSDWPLHVTVAPTFVVTVDLSAVAAAITPVVGSQRPLRVRVGQDEGFGRSGRIPVSVIEPTPELSDLHGRLVSVLSEIDAAFDDPEFIGPHYRAHVTKTRVAQSHPGDEMTLTQAAIVDMEPEGDKRLRRVVWAVPLLGDAR
jgi:2'-5' RNA ligase superfamily